MKKLSRWSMSILTLFMVLAISAMQVVPVLADDAAPPPPEATEVVPPEEETTPDAPPVEATEVPVTDVEVVPSTEEPVVPEEQVLPVAEIPAPEAETPAEVLAQVPEGTDLVVLDENGEALPLVSEEAAEVISNGDPQWCPVGVTPGSPSCSGTKDSFNGGNAATDLIQWLIENHPSVAGVIWIASDYNLSGTAEGGTPITLDGTVLLGLPTPSTIPNFALTIKGGWTGTGTTIDVTAPSVFNVPLNIINWTGAITLSDIVFSGVTAAGPALNVETAGNITLTNVDVGSEVDSNNSAGAVLDNTSGTGNILITTSEFSNNSAGTGLTASSKGTITLTNVNANGNGNGGAHLDNATGTAKAVTLTGTSIFSENATGDGLWISTQGAITISNLIANSNGGWGASLNNTPSTTLTTAPAVNLTGSNQFKFNGGGLKILSDGAITLNNVTAASNSDWEGALLNNTSSTLGSIVTLTGTNIFNTNGWDGLEVNSKGIITLNNVTATGNNVVDEPLVDSYGVYLNNSTATLAKAVLLNGINNLSDNIESGLMVLSTGAVTLNKLTVSGNGGAGAEVDNTSLGSGVPQNVTLIGYGTFNWNLGGTGLIVDSYGIINMANVTASDNGGGGAILDNCQWGGVGTACGTGASKTVTLTGNNTFSGNTGGSGLDIASEGAITINNVIADNNGDFGANLNNNWDGTVAGITVANTPTYFPSFSYNVNTGLNVVTHGNIVLKDLDAYGNGGLGASLDNTFSSAGATVMVGTTRAGWCNAYGGNASTGLEIHTDGVVTVSNLCNSGNGFGIDPLDPADDYGFGLDVSNLSAGGTPKTVTLLGSNSFDENYSGGVQILATGAITANKVTASYNSGPGAFFYNSTAPGLPQNVTLNGYGDFEGNVGSGLEIATYGSVTLNNLYAYDNTGHGIYVDNLTGGSQVKPVTINGYVEAYSNDLSGLTIFTRGAIKIANLDASSGNGTGAWLDNYNSGVPASPVSITGHTWTDGNLGDGLYIESLGSITLAGLSAWDNSGYGATLDNAWTGSTGIVTISGYASTGMNTGDGLVITSNRAITITNLEGYSNDGAGAILDNSYSGELSPQNVTINGYADLSYNGDDGLDVFTYGAITLNNVTANGNGQNLGPLSWGAYLDNCVDLGLGCTATKVSNVTLNGTNTFSNNFVYGLQVESLGIIKANNLTASDNGDTGAYLNNARDVGYYAVTLTGSNTFDWNDGDGLKIFSNGPVTINNLTANYNWGDGAYIDARNIYNPPGPKVTLTGNNTFIGNGDGTPGPVSDPGTGLIVISYSVITINNLTASGNTQEGAVLIAHSPAGSWEFWGAWGPFPNNIMLTGINTFNDNGLDGLYFESPGNVSITKLTADNNLGNGVDGYVIGNLTVTCGSMTNNAGYGWSFTSYTGVVTLKGVFAYGNGINTYLDSPWNPVYVRTCP